MPCGKWTITKVPEDQLETVIADSKLDNPNSVESEKQPDGTYTVTIIYDPCPGQRQRTNKVFVG